MSSPQSGDEPSSSSQPNPSPSNPAPEPESWKPSIPIQEIRIVRQGAGPIRITGYSDGKLVDAEREARLAGREDKAKELRERMELPRRHGPWEKECYEGPVQLQDKDGNIWPDITKRPSEVERRAKIRARIEAAEAAKAVADEGKT